MIRMTGWATMFHTDQVQKCAGGSDGILVGSHNISAMVPQFILTFEALAHDQHHNLPMYATMNSKPLR